LRGLKSAILYEEVAKGVRERGLDEEAILVVLTRESKKRNESAEIYQSAGANDRAAMELNEKSIIDAYLPAQLTDEELSVRVKTVLEEMGDSAQLGQAIGAVKRLVGSSADGARIAAAVKTALHQ
jgi:hypothetical protein